ncbi:MAG: hypothetical protein WC002_00260 [Candidatus Muiribacteriota bacterium]
MKKILISAFMFFFLVTNSFSDGFTFYENGDYENALGEFLKIEHKSEYDYYNIGNCYYRLNDNVNAVANYMKALTINPGLKDAQHNLMLLLGDEFKLLEWYFVPFNKFFLINMTLFLILFYCGAITIKTFFNKKNSTAVIIIMVLSILSLAYTLTVWIYTHKTDYAVVKEQGEIYSSPSYSGVVIGNFNPPVIVEIIEEGANFSNIIDNSGVSGWVENKNLIKIKEL